MNIFVWLCDTVKRFQQLPESLHVVRSVNTLVKVYEDSDCNNFGSLQFSSSDTERWYKKQFIGDMIMDEILRCTDNSNENYSTYPKY